MSLDITKAVYMYHFTGLCLNEPVICPNATDVCNSTNAPTCPGGPVSCMSGETGVYIKEGRKVKVKSVEKLKVGDVISGLDSDKRETPCTVKAIGEFGMGLVYGNYISDHLILDDSGSVSTHGALGEAKFTNKYTVLTDCPVGVDESGTPFTPIDSDFAGNSLSWANYVIVHKAILDLVVESGTGIWFSPSSYVSMDNVKQFLDAFYNGILTCETDPNNCDELEVATSNLVENSMTKDAKKIAKKAFPGLGRSKVKGSVLPITVSKGKSVRS